ncbi:type II toxin-antitoxin system HicA family toxin [Patescibacteria group bacterium]|nr:type II toxin-antitoxin system HicA family toxin [Patescibacteria group bacterium]MBU4458529.1 type II toxin-antitoxin system HicA family toxin [Patescibacteria group bacterium]
MPKFLNPRYIIKILEKRGFIYLSQKGSHKKYKKVIKQNALIVIVPMHSREIPIGTFKSILRQSNLQKEDFE